MEHRIEIRGLPKSLQRDAWWFATYEGAQDSPPGNRHEGADITRGLPLLFGLALLVLLADLLFWEKRVGLSLALFAYAVFATANSDRLNDRSVLGPAALLVLSSLPVIEFVQPLSNLFLMLGLITALVWARNDSRSLAEFGQNLLGFIAALPDRFLRPFASLFQIQKTLRPQLGTVKSWLSNWGVPIGGSLIFAGLILHANPILADLISVSVPVETLLPRALFWTGVALLTAPFLIRETSQANLPALSAFPQQKLGALGLNAGSCLRSLWLFNAMIGVQTLMDLSIFLGGASLPDGMTYATYAHRGSYPLLATALLAGLFAVLTHPFVNEHKAMKPLIYLWLAQNIALCLSAILRLDLYVDVYGLTYLRIYAMIWIGLVAAGLALIAWQTKAQRSNLWLISAFSGVTLSTLYVCCFVNFAAIIVARNLPMDKPDMGYICDLNPTARGALDQKRADMLGHRCAINKVKPLETWQEWGFRNWRSGLYDDSARTSLKR